MTEWFDEGWGHVRKLNRRGFLGLAGAAGLGGVWSVTGISQAKAWADRRSGATPSPWASPRATRLRRRGALDPARARAAGRRRPRRDARHVVAGHLGGRRGRPLPPRRQARRRAGHPGTRPRGARRGATACAPTASTSTGSATGDAVSPVGRTRTAPSALQPATRAVVRVRLLPELPDRLLHRLRAPGGTRTSTWSSTSATTSTRARRPAPLGRAHLPVTEIFSLADYRIRHAQYKTDADLQTRARPLPVVVTWDDHEVENNYADDDLARTRRSDPERSCAAGPPPTRPTTSTCRCAARPLPRGADMRLYRRLRYGRLAEFNVLDTRQYRDDQVTRRRPRSTTRPARCSAPSRSAG